MANETYTVDQMYFPAGRGWPSTSNALARELSKALGRRPTAAHPNRGGSPERDALAKRYRENEAQRAKGGNPL